ncbi:hypothetical protein [Curtobacterium sp. L1-20]|uniref:hypothetical protein n=1 Tax=Curtobacterium sp. L1-20 TaxID=3138181 RepID=UPI003B52E903
MTDHDRNDQDRAGDGRVPNWGEGQQPASAPADQPGHDAPRYGERAPEADAPRYGERAPEGHTPQYGAQQYDAPSDGDQQGRYGQVQHDQHQYGQQPYAASSAPTSAGAPAWQSYEEPKRKKKTVGVVAFVLGLASLVIGVVGGYLMGSALANSDAISKLVPTDGSTPDQGQLQQQLMNDPNVVSQLGVGAVVAGVAALLGLWALVQGIIAIATKRGRGWGVFAVVLAAVATIATFATYIGVAAAAAVGGGN